MSDLWVSDFWKAYATRLQGDLAAAAVDVTAPSEVIAANAGAWFAELQQNTQAALIGVLRNLNASPAV